MNKPSCAWTLEDLKAIPPNGVKVMTTFACGGGSSMGYKLAGCEIVAANDIDPEMAYHYKLNLKPKHYFLCPIRDLLTMQLPEELQGIDILDGSPPCSTFSMAGSRESAWGKEKHFREGQAKQVLSDLFFDYLDLVEKLRPKVAIAENVKGMIIGNAKGYCKLIMSRFREIGYRPQLFLVNAADCGVPQKRERVFFCAVRNDIDVHPLKLAPKHRWISTGEACEDLGNKIKGLYLVTAGNERHVKAYRLPIHDPYSQPSPCLTATNNQIDLISFDRKTEERAWTFREYARLGSFPDDYKAKTDKIGKYMIGMSVPPRMAEQVARAVCAQWLGVKY
jgi:DNA (cytosine-5)-methyltransferase 1